MALHKDVSNEWQEFGTLSVDTVFQSKSDAAVLFDADEGLPTEPHSGVTCRRLESVVFGAGQTVYVRGDADGCSYSATPVGV